MNDTLNYFRSNPFFRGSGYHQITFSMMYYYKEQYLSDIPWSFDLKITYMDEKAD